MRKNVSFFLEIRLVLMRIILLLFLAFYVMLFETGKDIAR